jgi:translation initiation factor 3 subunit A
VGQSLAALQSLHEIMTSKRSKSASLQSLEPIMLRFVELCVSLRKGKLAKEGLYQFKNIAQNTNVSSIEVFSRLHLPLAYTVL